MLIWGPEQRPAPTACGGFDWLAQCQAEAPAQVPGAVLWAGPGCADHAGVTYPHRATSHWYHLHQEAAQGAAGRKRQRKCTMPQCCTFIPPVLCYTCMSHIAIVLLTYHFASPFVSCMPPCFHFSIILSVFLTGFKTEGLFDPLCWYLRAILWNPKSQVTFK